MSRNPRLSSPPPPRKPYRLVVAGGGPALRVDPEHLPDEDGFPGSILSTLLAGGVDIPHACAGVGACGTCHVRILEGAGSLPLPTEEEEDLLDMVPGVGEDSRMACLCVPDGSGDVVVEIPSWGRHEVKEGH